MDVYGVLVLGEGFVFWMLLDLSFVLFRFLWFCVKCFVVFI